ncbi:3-hydroxyacyl-ACP dehydratase FabZ family protein [Streptomyces sp. NPDC005017]|uniref:3-hydroxyacyl-ACP dehydratase FabZ family protein n=1 Tax=Streptomyces sp. NPDC005017 TaxID=3364706 RepID=UPI0036942479
MAAVTRGPALSDALVRPALAEEIPGGTRVTVRLPVDIAAAQMAGHYPGFPILPGVLVIDWVDQTVRSAHGAALRLCGIDRARFCRPLFPGDELHLAVSVTREGAGRLAVRARGVCAQGRTAVELSATYEPVTARA